MVATSSMEPSTSQSAWAPGSMLTTGVVMPNRTGGAPPDAEGSGLRSSPCATVSSSGVMLGERLFGVDALVEGGRDRLGLAQPGQSEQVLDRGQRRVVVVGGLDLLTRCDER